VARTLVKICGLTRLEDVRVAIDAGADWIGFIVSGESPRRITPECAAEMIAALPGAVGVAVMVSPSPAEALDLARRAGATRVQVHRSDPAVWPVGFELPLAFAVPVGVDGIRAEALPPARHLVLLDTAAAVAGGTGRTFDWQHAVPVALARPIMIAGGLDADNVADVIERVRPFGVDASSRLERSPGIKDADLIRRFVAAVRACDDRLARLA
jgi:phosphoribosylanthranilate isomerase